MKRFLLVRIFTTAVIVAGFPWAIGNPSASGAGAEQTALQADHAFMQAVGKADKAALEPLLDADLLWTDYEGRTQDRAQMLAQPPSSAIDDADSKSYTYGQVVTVRSDSGKRHVLRVWVQRPAGWRLLVYHEVKQADTAAGGPPAPPVKECINPCKTIPYEPKNGAEAGVIKSWQALETAVFEANSQAWAQHFADEFVVISSGATDPVTKAGRMAILDAQKKAGTAGSPGGLAPDHTRMFTIGDTVVMNCQSQPHRGKPAHVTRVWVKRGGNWLMTTSFQTTIQSAAPAAGE